ncbi:ATP-binding protein [Streptomyces sp. NPDC005728]|uniref:ATP-binding protein n=1 Tax=Streptomyces sp. NPDC005728 TaxID=3157054 RepID=UPI0033E5B387
MATERRGDGTPPSEERYERAFSFPGELPNVTGARLAAEEFLSCLAQDAPPGTPEYWDDILLVVTELAANAVQYAPGPFGLRMRRTFDGVHVMMHDTSTTRPAPRPFRPTAGGGGIGWHLVHTLGSQVSVVVHDQGKDIHVFLPW